MSSHSGAGMIYLMMIFMLMRWILAEISTDEKRFFCCSTDCLEAAYKSKMPTLQRRKFATYASIISLSLFMVQLRCQPAFAGDYADFSALH